MKLQHDPDPSKPADEGAARELARLLGDREISLADLSDEWARIRNDPEFRGAYEVAIKRLTAEHA